uniref:Uncharacterized protein n=1 Tax=Physcomitrium patens TaxID=3218 RepID=A0A2K1K485_PHYPA|nr:hypothetical protein PHYPA_013064 [Physcomitrium patens]
MCLDGHLQRCPRGSWMHCRPWEYATHLRFPRFLRVRSELEEHGGEVKFYTRGPYYTLPTVLRAYNHRRRSVDPPSTEETKLHVCAWKCIWFWCEGKSIYWITMSCNTFGCFLRKTYFVRSW